MPAIHPARPPALRVLAGKQALARLRRDGLSAADVALIPGAAGGPKALGLTGLDCAVFGDWLPGAARHRHLVGSSIGCWRFGCVLQADPAAAFRRFAQSYTEQAFARGISAEAVTSASRSMLGDMFGPSLAQDFARRDDYTLTILTVRCVGKLAEEARGTLLLALGRLAAGNALGRHNLTRGFERVVFCNGEMPPLFDDFPTQAVALTAGNTIDALLATAAIPMVMAAIRDPAGAPPGVYRDGGMMDYHLDLPYPNIDGLVLYPHFYPKIVPGWFDKTLPWRRPLANRLDNVILLAPSADYLSRLPGGKIPDRKDFTRLDNDTRRRHWCHAIAESDRLGDEFLQVVQSGRLGELAEALS